MAFGITPISIQIAGLLAALDYGGSRGRPATGWQLWLIRSIGYAFVLFICWIIASQVQGGWRRKMLITGLWLVGMAALVHFGHVIGALFLPS